MLDAELFKLLEGTSDAAFVVDGQGVTRSWNKAAERLFGYRAAEVIGRPCAETVKGHGTLGTAVCQDDCQVLQCVASGCDIPNFDLEVRTRSGNRLWTNVSILQIRDGRTRRQYAVHFVRDIRERKKAEAAGQKLVEAAKELVALSAPPSRSAPVGALTSQEQRILRLLATGRALSDIRRELQISNGTLRNHLHHVNQKLRTKNRLAAVMHAVQCGLV